MEVVLDIFRRLEVDQTIFHQFFIFLVMYLILKPLLFKKLLFVIEMREGKTTKLESHAHKKFAEAEKLSAEYDEKIKSINAQAQKKFHDSKESLEKDEKSKIQKLSKELESEAQARREKFQEDFKKRQENVDKSVDALSEKLVEKLVQ